MSRGTKRDNAQAVLDGAPLTGSRIPAQFYKDAARKSRGAKNRKPEEIAQKEIVDWLRTQPAILFWSTPNHFYLNGGDNGRISAYIAKQKSLGMLNGVPDLTIIFRNKHGATAVAFAEVKAGSNKASDAQAAFLDKANGLGCFTAVCYGLDDVKALLKAAGYF